ncbi:hypothetical protein PRBRB14_18040 [Hallella multisaccharivorax DSM 17128]|uniref:Lanthionine synthetase C family protein n=1 Tax=Hallella multisaccharivorax DSM 17128 TaxID=688246 RepID=F8N9Z3_9BACT|nr:lanthionine synthetase LanC family protein [Hallella multisaccharivorax]EGN57810.1 hypothetical protein Premu_2438 [Hallella multisaccharivorax DSM 17128]GJG30925.1 hypothetical protein PRBRB14_18040 [Hallella multisaccharivorax DSM 17128]
MLGRIPTNLINYLALQSAQITDHGLYHGRMGIILALYCYGLCHNDHAICEFVWDILQCTAENYNDGDISLENGLAGIGLGYTLLYKAGMFQDNLNELLFDIDKKIMSIDPRRVDNYSFEKGALGILFYIEQRQSLEQPCESIDEKFVQELKDNVRKNTCYGIKHQQLKNSIRKPDWDVSEYRDKNVGIDNGSAFYVINESYDKIFSNK